HQRVEPAERVLADARDDPLPHGEARKDEVRPGEPEPEEHDLRGRGHGRVLTRGRGLRQEGALPLALDGSDKEGLMGGMVGPFGVQQRLWALVPDARYVAEPVVRDGRPVAGSKHNRGAAVDLTLVDAAGRPLEMPSGFDDFSERAHPGWAGASPAARRNVARLEEAMAAEGFEPLPTEWWHFDGPGWERYELLDRPL